MNMIPQHQLDGKMIELIAKAIAQCDFRVTISKYMGPQNWPWIITVGESYWQRHLAVIEISEDCCDAALDVLKSEQSGNSGYNISWSDVERRISLSDLIADKYRGVKSILKPKSVAA